MQNSKDAAPAPKRIRLEPKGIQEKDVGITHYICPDTPGFTGILKARYSDFQVNEISAGEAVHLKLEMPARPEPEPKTESELKPDSGPGQPSNPPPDISEHLDELNRVLGPDLVAAINGLFSTGTKVESSKAYSDKEERTAIHRLCANAWNNRLETETLKDGKILVKLATKRQRKPKMRAKGEGDFIKFAVFKENKETMEVASIIAKLLRFPTKSIGFAGTKDKRGATTQYMTVKNVSLERVQSLNYALKNAKLGNFCHTKEALRLGDLDGNQFYIALRNVNSYDNVDAALRNLKNLGFINYFGLQRFGTFSVSTHTVGRMILAGDYDGAVDALLQPQELSSPDSAEARAAWKAGDIKKALELMPRKCSAEHSILTSLQESSSRLNAILRVPRNLKLMYVHAYQSYIWNSAATERIRAHGLEIRHGDLVLAGIENGFERARPVTAEEIEQGTKTIYDVVLPTPGFDIVYPSNLVEFYQNEMQKDAVDCHKMRRNVREFSLSGSYRHIVAKPGNVEWWRSSYAAEDDTLIRTDLEQAEQNTDEKIVSTEGPQKALILKMDLGASQYATMALREVMKAETSRHGELFFG